MSWKRWAAVAVLLTQLPAVALTKPADLPIDQRINYANGPETTPIAPAVLPTSPGAVRAVEVFERAERQRRQGQLHDARRGYQEVHLLAPTSRVGQQAIQRLRDLEAPGNGFSEEQEPPLDRRSYRPSYQPRRETNRVKPSRLEYLEMLRETEPLEIAPSPF